MKILFAIQGTGNGHLSRAHAIYPELMKYAEVDILISGYQSEINQPFPVKYRRTGLSFIFGKKGGIDFGATLKRFRPLRLIKDIFSLPVTNYDLVVNDFEPVSAWAAKLRGIPCMSLSHQFAVRHPEAPEPMKGSLIGKLVLRYYAPVKAGYGFHFERYGADIFPPVIRKEIQDQVSTTGNYYTVYLPAYDDNALISFLSRFKNISFQVFSKHNKEAFQFEQISIQPIENSSFVQSLANCRGALMGAGFEGPAEALYLQKKLMVIPMKGQYEQQCNAAALEALGVPAVPQLNARTYKRMHQWIEKEQRVKVAYPKDTAAVAVAKLITDFKNNAARTRLVSVPPVFQKQHRLTPRHESQK